MPDRELLDALTTLDPARVAAHLEAGRLPPESQIRALWRAYQAQGEQLERVRVALGAPRGVRLDVFALDIQVGAVTAIAELERAASLDARPLLATVRSTIAAALHELEAGEASDLVDGTIRPARRHEEDWKRAAADLTWMRVNLRELLGELAAYGEGQGS